ncbi:MAG: matrixin family metalloprotease [Candidatus Binatia bacterium]
MSARTRGGARRRAASLLVLAIALCTDLLARARSAEAYAFLYVPSSQGVPRRWNQGALPDARVPWRISAGIGGNVTGDRGALDVIASAFGHWEDLSTSAIRFAFDGTSNARNRNANDRVNLVTLNTTESLGSGVLAATFLTSDASGNLVDVDIVFSRDVAFSTSGTVDAGSYDLESVATHEAGHFLGLEHSGLARATMVPFTDRGEGQQRTPSEDDRIGASLLYPEDGFLAGTGALAGRISVAGASVYLAQVVAARVNGPVVAQTYSAPDGTYRIEGLAPDVYVVYAEPLDGPVVPGNVGGFRSAFGGTPSTGYGTFFH